MLHNATITITVRLSPGDYTFKGKLIGDQGSALELQWPHRQGSPTQTENLYGVTRGIAAVRQAEDTTGWVEFQKAINFGQTATNWDALYRIPISPDEAIPLPKDNEVILGFSPAEMKEQWERACAQGDVGCMIRLYKFFRQRNDAEAAVAWLLAAGVRGSGEAYGLVSNLYRFGELGFPKHSHIAEFCKTMADAAAPSRRASAK
jgi:hypothetical protein